MAVIDTAGWTARTGITPTGADATAIAQFCTDVSEALTRKCYPILLEPKTLTLFAFDAPVSRSLLLPRPIRAISALYYHSGANGDSSVLDLTADLLDANTDYLSRVDDVLTGWNRSGEVLRLNRSVWGWVPVAPPGALGYRLEVEPGSVFVSGTFGPTTTFPAAANAAATAVTLMFNRRTFGSAFASESWNGRSQSLAAPVTAEAAVNSPEVTGILQAAGLLPIHVG